MSNSYIKTKESINFFIFSEKNFSLSASNYKELTIGNKNTLYVKDFLDRDLLKEDLGIEIGSNNYIEQSPYKFMRTKALQAYSFIPDFNKESVLPCIPSSFIQMNLKKGDLIISKDSNIGEAIILDQDYQNVMLSSALYRLPVTKHKYYLFAFLKHSVFREQLDFIVPKGATIRHAKDLFLKCKIPIPNYDTQETYYYIECLVEAIINKEKLIKKRHKEILTQIKENIELNQIAKQYSYSQTKLNDLISVGRLDASLYSDKYKSKIFPILNYKFGYRPLTRQGLDLKPGPSLEIKLLETRIDSDVYVDGFYRLITPKQILNTGILNYEKFIGTKKKISNLKFGDILFGESGTGRTMVFLDKNNKTINNAHAHVLRPIEKECSLDKAITIRCILQYYKEIGITDCLTVGGNGGHLSPSYFDRIFIPNFDEKFQHEISKLYHTPKEYQLSDIPCPIFWILTIRTMKK